MFQMDIAEYVRLSYESLETACVAHAAQAARLSRLSAWFRGATLGCAAIAAGFSAVAASGRPGWPLAAAIAAAVAFAVCAAYVGFNQQPRIHGHRVCSARLWLVCEKYRGLLAEMHEGMVDLPALRERRHALLEEAAAVFQQAAPADRCTFELAQRALGQRPASPAVPVAGS